MKLLRALTCASMTRQASSPGESRGFFVPEPQDEDREEIRSAVGGRIISKRAYEDCTAFAAFIKKHGLVILADLKTFLAKEAEAGRRAGSILSWEKAAHALAGTRCCRRCGETKLAVEFQRGGAWLCKPCDAARDRDARRANRERVCALQRRRRNVNIDKARADARARAKTPRARRQNQAAVETYRQKFPERARAQRLAYEAERCGDIVHPDCCQAVDCEVTGRLHRHHNDYSRPVDVIWLCHMHHEEVHHIGPVRLKPGSDHDVAHAPRKD